MSDSDNFSRRISLRTKELLSSNTGFSALLIFLTLLLLGFVFGMRFQPQPFIIQDASSLDPDLISTIDQSASSQQNMNERIVTNSEFTSSPNQRLDPVYVQKEKFEDYLSLNEEGRKIERQHANELSDLVVTQQKGDISNSKSDEIVETLNNQFEQREQIIEQEDLVLEELISRTEKGVLPATITNGHTKALVEEKSLEASLAEYERSLNSDEELSEEAKNKIRDALSVTTEKFNEERQGRRDRLTEAKALLSNDEMSISEQENLRSLIEDEDMEYANALRRQQMELDQMVDEGITNENIIKDSSNDYQMQKYQSEMLAEDINELLDALESEEGMLVKPDQTIEELLSEQSDQSPIQDQIDDSKLFLIDSLDDIDEEKKEELIARGKKEQSSRSNLKEKKQLFLKSLALNERSGDSLETDAPPSLVDQIKNVEEGLDIANQKIDLILRILSENNSSEILKKDLIRNPNQDSQERINQDEVSFTDSNKKDEQNSLMNEPLFTLDQVTDENQDLLEEQIESEKNEFNNFSGVDGLSESLKMKVRSFLSRATYSPKPQYPRDAEKTGLEGDCLVSFRINPNGMTENTTANCTNDVFVSPTEMALQKWEFEPDEYINPMIYVVYNLKG
jgi:hypothetical protein